MKPEDWDPRDVEISDNMRAFVSKLLKEARAAERAAENFEQARGIWPPCHLCGRRTCGH